MTDLLSKPASEIGLADIDALVSSGLPEGEQVEFKRSLSTAKGKPDPWEDGKEPGDRAKIEILEEVTAFANAYGGVLVLGIEDSLTKSAVASAIAPVPRCTDLAERFKLVFRDCVEPKLSGLEVIAVLTAGESGVIVFRVGRSHSAPHRVTKTMVCPVRRADRCERMTMREIQDMTLSVSRGLERLDKRLSERSKRFGHEFERLVSSDDAFGCRFTAVPTHDDIEFDRVFRNDSLAGGFNFPWRNILLDGRPIIGVSCGPRSWRALLRGARSDNRMPEVEHNEEGRLIPKKIDRNFFHEIHCDGLVEFCGLHVSRWEHQSFPPRWLFVMFGNLLLWVKDVRRLSHPVSAEYLVEVELYMTSRSPLPIDEHGDAYWRPENPNQKFPHYVISGDSDVVEVFGRFYRDVYHLVGQDMDATLAIGM